MGDATWVEYDATLPRGVLPMPFEDCNPADGIGCVLGVLLVPLRVSRVDCGTSETPDSGCTGTLPLVPIGVCDTSRAGSGKGSFVFLRGEKKTPTALPTTLPMAPKRDDPNLVRGVLFLGGFG